MLGMKFRIMVIITILDVLIFPKINGKKNLDKRQGKNVYFAYILDSENNEFIGYCNYQYNEKSDKYECGLLIEAKYRGKGYSKEVLTLLCEEARKNGIKELYDTFEVDRGDTLKIFEAVGFKIVNELTWKKFDMDVNGVEVKIEL